MLFTTRSNDAVREAAKARIDEINMYELRAAALLAKASKKKCERAATVKLENAKDQDGGGKLSAVAKGREGARYSVKIDLIERRASCTCPDFVNRRGVCKHMVALADGWIHAKDQERRHLWAVIGF